MSYGDRGQQLVAVRRRLRFSLQHHLAALNGNEAVAQAERLRHILLDQEDGAARRISSMMAPGRTSPAVRCPHRSPLIGVTTPILIGSAANALPSADALSSIAITLLLIMRVGSPPCGRFY
jgi:hypothetical protein